MKKALLEAAGYVVIDSKDKVLWGGYYEWVTLLIRLIILMISFK